MIKWNPEKNKILYKTRGVTFDEIVQAISDGYAVMINNYAHLVPYFKDGEDYFLKTIIPSRKANKQVLGEKNV